MKSRISKYMILSFLIIYSSLLIAQDTWEHVYDPYPYFDGYLREDVVKCSDGGYAFCGSGFVEDPWNPGFYIEHFGITFKLDADGILEWIDQDTVSYIPMSKDYGLAHLSDGSIVTAVGPEFAGNCALIKRDTQGNRVWQIYPGPIFPHSLIDTEDGGVVAVGNAPWEENNIKKFSSEGELQWEKRIRASNLYSVVTSFDGGFITSGVYYGQNNGDVAVAKTDADGDTLWTKYLDGFGDADYGKCVIETSTHNILVFGEFVNLYTGSPGYIWMLDQNGETIDLEIIDQDIGWAIWSANEYLDNSIITWGNGPDHIARYNRFNSELEHIDTMIDLCSGGDKGFIIDNSYLVFCKWPDLTVNKTMYQPVSIEDNFIPSNDNILLTNYPNPFNPQTNILFHLPTNFENPVLEIFNVKGQFMESFKLKTNQSSIIWDASKYSTGIYLYQIKSDNLISVINKMTLLK